jgi:hypothetical protein
MAEIHVITADDLIHALSSATDGDVILFDSPDYTVGVPLFVPDGVTLKGAGVMGVVDGLPVGFRGPTTTIIKAGPDLKGNLVTLGNRSSLRGLVLQGASEFLVDDEEGRGGNTVAVASRGQHDVVSATIEGCELYNTITAPGGPDGPAGGVILVYTRNPQQGADPRPHEHARVSLALTSSIVRTAPDGGTAVFAMNFASHGQVTVTLTQNDIGGSLDVVGGMARPDAVEHATTTVTSTGNHYSPPQTGSDKGWQITGGSTPPPPTFPSSANADSNTANANSTDDQIEKFQVGISAVGGRRLNINHGTCSNSTVNLTLTRMKLPTPTPDTADFEFVGALTLGHSPFPTGDKNAVNVDVFAGTTPSDRLFHIDVHGAGFGTGKQLVFEGTLAALQNFDFG